MIVSGAALDVLQRLSAANVKGQFAIGKMRTATPLLAKSASLTQVRKSAQIKARLRVRIHAVRT
jgi:hypothetical protein